MWGKRMVALVALAVVAGACGDDGDDADARAGTSPASPAATTEAQEGSSDEQCTEERKGGSLTFATVVRTTALDPIIALGSGGAGGIELSALYDNLLRYDPATGEFEPHVAESFSSNEDRTEWTVKLRPGITFGNGDPLTADAVKFSFERMATARVSSSALAATVETMTVVDPLTIVFRLKAPFGQFPYVLAEDTGAIVNPNVVNERGAEAFNMNPTGAGVGPFELQRFAPGEEVVMKAKDDYWGGPVCIDTLRFVSIPGAAGTYEAFTNGEVDMAYLSEPLVVAKAEEDGAQGYTNIANASTLLFMNIGVRNTSSPLEDIRIRRAVVAAIDVDLINTRVYEGHGLTTSALIWEDSPLYTGAEGPAYDPDLARRLVDEAKGAGWDGHLRLIGSNVPLMHNLAITVEGMLEAVGMEIDVETLEPTEASRRILIEPDFDLGISGMSIYESSPYARLDQFETGSVRSRTGLSHPDMDAALDELRRAASREEKQAAIAEIQRVWNEDVPSAVIASAKELVATHDHVRGVVYSRDTVPLFHQAFVVAS